MPRIVRGLQAGQIYHVINRGNCRNEVFHEDSDFIAFSNLLLEAREQYQVKLFAYCLMSNHFHLLVKPEKGEELSKMMQWVMTSHVRRYHKKKGTSGHVWQGRYKSFIVQDDDHLLTVARYIEGNPVRAGMVKSVRDWKWSSHMETSGESERKVTTAMPRQLPLNWSNYVDSPLTDRELERLRQSVNRQSPYGLSEWVTDLCNRFGLESTIRKRGRPVKSGEK